jgi:hypothetical protein
MQHQILREGELRGYIWTPEIERMTGKMRAPDLVPLGKAGDHGPLSDAYGPQLLKDGLAVYNEPRVQDFIKKLNRFSLMMKTAGDVAGAVHNYLGNVGFSLSNLIWAATTPTQWGNVFGSIGGAFKITGARALGTTLPKWTPFEMSKAARGETAKMIRLGVFDTDIAINSVRKIIRVADVASRVEKRAGLEAALHAAGKLLRGTWGGMKTFYQAADNWWKYFNYRLELSKQQWIYEKESVKPSPEEMERRAADNVSKFLPSIKRVPEFMRVFEKSVAGTVTGAFLTFQVEAARTGVMNVREGWRETLYGVNGRERWVGASRMAAMIAMGVIPLTLLTITRRLFGYSDDEEEAIRANLPEFQRDSAMLVFGPKKDGRPRYWDVSWLNPYGLYHGAAIAAARGWGEGKDFYDSVWGAGSEGFNALTKQVNPFRSQAWQPGISAVIDSVFNRDSLKGGKEIYNPEDTFENKSWKVGERAWRGFAPGTAIKLHKATLAAIGYKDERTGKPLDVTQESLALTGFPRMYTIEPDLAMAGHVAKFKGRMADARKLVNRTLTSENWRPEETKAAYEQAHAQGFEIFTELNTAYKQMKKLNIPEREIRTAMEEAFGTDKLKGGISKDKINEIISGRFLPIEISDKMKDNARKYYPDRLKEYEKVRRTKKIQRVLPL